MKERATLILFTLALALAFVAQYFFGEDRIHYREALLLYGVAIAVIWVYALLEGRWPGSPDGQIVGWSGGQQTLVLSGNEGNGPGTIRPIDQQTNFTPLRFALSFASVLALAFSLMLQRRGTAYPGQVVFWLASMAFLVAACWPYGTPVSTYWHRLKSQRVEVGLVILIVALGFALRAYDLDSIPGGFHGDEGEWAMDAVGIMEGRPLPPFGTGWDMHPSLFSYLQALTMKVFGMNVMGVRMLSAIAGALTVPALYLLIRRMFDRWAATVAAFLLAVSHWHIHFSRLAMNDIEVPLFTTLIIYFLYRGLESRRPLDYCLSGMSLGLAFYFGNKSHLLPPLIVLLLLYLVIFRRGFLRHQWRNILLFLIAALLTFAPLGLFYSRHGWEGFLVKRMNDRFIFNNMDRLLATYGTTEVLDVLRMQTERALLVFNYYSDASGFYGFIQEPVLDFFTAALYVLGIAYSVYRWRDARYALLLCWFGLILQGSLLSIDPPQAHRIIALIPVPFAFAAIAVEQLREELTRAVNWRKAIYWALPLALFLGTVAYVNIDAYFVRYAQWWPWLDITTMARYIRDLGQDHLIYFFGTPHTYIKHGTIRFIAHGVDGVDVANVADVVPVRQEVDRDVAFILMGSHLQTLSFIESYYPGGVLRNFEDAKGRKLFAGYLVTQQEVASKQGLVARYYQGASWEGDPPSFPPIGGDEGGREGVAVSFDQSEIRSLPYSVRWQGTIHLPSQGSYLMGLDSTQPSRLLIDDSLLVDNPGGRQASEVSLAAGPHAITVMGIAASSQDAIALYWRPPYQSEMVVPRYVLTPRSEANGLLGSYYSNADWAGEAVLQRIDPLISFRWFHQPEASPFSVRWEGWIRVPESGRYTFETFSNGQVWLSIDNQLVLHNDQQVVERWYTSQADLIAGLHTLELRYCYLSGWRLLELYWTRPDGRRELVPAEVFLPRHVLSFEGKETVLATDAETHVAVGKGLAWGSQGVAPGQFDNPQDIAVDAQGNVYVADSGNRRVQVFDPAGRFIASWQGGDERFVEPSAVAWDENGYVLVLDSGTGWIHRFTGDGRFLEKFGGPEAGFLCPCRLAVSEAGQVYVLDSGHNRVQVLEPTAQ